MPPANLIVLQGQIERITFTSDETGYTVAKVWVYGHRDLATVIGAMVNPNCDNLRGRETRRSWAYERCRRDQSTTGA